MCALASLGFPAALHYCRSTNRGTKRWTPAPACLLVLVLLAASGTLGQPAAPQGSNSNAADPSISNPATTSSNDSSSSTGITNSTEPQGSSELLGWLLQRLQRTLQLQPSQPKDSPDDSSSDQADDAPDFASTANALTQQAVREANVRAAALAQRTAYDAEQQGSSTGNSTNGSSRDIAALQLFELGQQTTNSSSSNDRDSEDSTDDMEGLQLLLQTIREQWEAARNRQRQQQQPASDSSSDEGARRPGEQWAAGLQAMAAKYPSLGGFARLAVNNSALQVSHWGPVVGRVVSRCCSFGARCIAFSAYKH